MKKQHILPFTLLLAVLFLVACSSEEATIPTSVEATAVQTEATDSITATDDVPIETAVSPTNTPEASLPTIEINPDIDLSQTIQSNSGSLTFNYPADWQIAQGGDSGKNIFSNSYYLSNQTPGDFTSQPDEISVSFFEPLAVIETLQLKDSRNNSFDDLIAQIIPLYPEELQGDFAEPVEGMYLNGNPFSRLDYEGNFSDTIFLFVRTPDGFVSLFRAETPPGELTQTVETIQAITSTYQHTMPSQSFTNDDPEYVIQQLLQISSQNGNLEDIERQLLQLYCQNDQLLGAAFQSVLLSDNQSTFGQLFQGSLDTANLAREQMTFDYSNLFIEPTLEQEAVVFVRVGGNVVVTAADVEALAPYSATTTNGNLIPLKRESDRWTICYNQDYAATASDGELSVVDQPKVYWLDESFSQLRRSNLDGSNLEIVLRNMGDVRYFTLDEDEQAIYWTSDKSLGIYRSDLTNPEDTQQLVCRDDCPNSIHYNDLNGIALDKVNEKLYWLSDREIYRANLDGSNIETLQQGLWFVRDIVIDPINNTIYWATITAVFKANLDASGMEEIWSGPNEIGANEIGFLTLDQNNQKLIWSDDRDNSLAIYDIATGSINTIEGDFSKPSGVAVDSDKGHLYFGDTQQDMLLRVNMDGSELVELALVNTTTTRRSTIADIELDFSAADN